MQFESFYTVRHDIWTKWEKMCQSMRHWFCDPKRDVFIFQEQVLGNAFPERPKKLEGADMERTVTFLEEELSELKEAGSISDQADALIDLIYFSFGALHQMGVNSGRVWNEVHRANMEKKRGTTKREVDNDACKPADWRPPDHSWLDKDPEDYSI